MKTTTVKPSAAKWYIVDASAKPLGRLAADISRVLRGKHKVEWSPHQVHSDHVIVINTQNVLLTGNKMNSKAYVSHSGYFGHLKRIPFSRMSKKNPNHIVARAVKGMLPRNRLRRSMMKHLHLFPDAEHPHKAQKPGPLSDIFPEKIINGS